MNKRLVTPLSERRYTCTRCGKVFAPAFEAQTQCCVEGFETEVAAEPLPRRPTAYDALMARRQAQTTGNRRCALSTCDRRVHKGQTYCSQAHANMGRCGSKYATLPRPPKSGGTRKNRECKVCGQPCVPKRSYCGDACYRIKRAEDEAARRNEIIAARTFGRAAFSTQPGTLRQET